MAVVHNESHQVTTADPAAHGAAVADIEAVYRSRLDAFVRVCTALLGNREQAIDAVHDSFAAALTRRASFRGDGSVEGWLWAVVVNAARNHRRARAVRQAEPEREGGGPAPSEPPEPRLRDHVAQLPERQRLVLFLRYYADLDYQEVAEAVGIAVGTVGSTLNAAHTTLHAALAEEADDDRPRPAHRRAVRCAHAPAGGQAGLERRAGARRDAGPRAAATARPTPCATASR